MRHAQRLDYVLECIGLTGNMLEFSRDPSPHQKIAQLTVETKSDRDTDHASYFLSRVICSAVCQDDKGDQLLSREYHLSEIEIAKDPTHPAHILPPPMPATAQILDIGCGAGQSLLAAYPGRVTFGIDIDLQALEIGRALTEEVKFTCGRAENLPFRDAFFDAVISRVALPYTNIPVSLREIRRVIKQDGTLWMTVHSFAVPWRVVKRTGIKGRIFLRLSSSKRYSETSLPCRRRSAERTSATKIPT